MNRSTESAQGLMTQENVTEIPDHYEVRVAGGTVMTFDLPHGTKPKNITSVQGARATLWRGDRNRALYEQVWA
jgi:hypothetical protein